LQKGLLQTGQPKYADSNENPENEEMIEKKKGMKTKATNKKGMNKKKNDDQFEDQSLAPQ